MDLVDRFYKTVYANKIMLGTVFIEFTPLDMVVSQEYRIGGWVDWKLIRRSEGIDPALTDFELEIGYSLPHLFKLWHSRYYTLYGQIGIARLPEIPSNNPLEPLRKTYYELLPEQLYQIGLIPFGDEGMMDAGPLCFDTRQPMPDADWPIVYWDHEWANSDREISPAVFSSFGKLLECAIHYWSPGVLGWKAQQKRIRGFFHIDPHGAGSTGQDYWESGIIPDV